MAAPTGLTLSRARPLLVTADTELLDDVLRLAAAVGADVDVAPDPIAAGLRYPAAPLVLVGVDQAAACIRVLPRRSAVILLARHTTEPPPFEVAEELQAEHLALLPPAEPWLAGRFAELTGRPVTRPGGRVMAVLGGRGGAGASVLAAGLAVTASRAGQRVLLVDADPLGGGVDLVLGWEAIEGMRWPALTYADLATPGLADFLPRQGDFAVLSCGRADLPEVPAAAMAAVIEAGRRSHDVIVVDLPRRLDQAAATALAAADRALLMVPAELRACAAAARVASVATGYAPDLQVVVRGPAPGRLKAAEVARAVGVPLAASLRAEPDLPRCLERGEAPASSGKGPLAELCQRLISELDAAPATGDAA